ncbi:hypothetical protein Pint_33159 [Pistacia integerrima]|uniref:Uncharacterized protein n=1 Tax=Pistacia integerrima TaxID=434235 RepID=A0ACC0X623_9ROSI|nr:hypothetical protein Pint_33159 [Pistacia integerrima]
MLGPTINNCSTSADAWDKLQASYANRSNTRMLTLLTTLMRTTKEDEELIQKRGEIKKTDTPVTAQFTQRSSWNKNKGGFTHNRNFFSNNRSPQGSPSQQHFNSNRGYSRSLPYQGPEYGASLVRGRNRNRLYEWPTSTPTPPSAHLTMTSYLWHQRLRHPSLSSSLSSHSAKASRKPTTPLS